MKNFPSARKRTTGECLVKASREEIFPLLCPVREYDWIDGWQCDLMASESGFAEEDCVFRSFIP